MYNHLKSWIRRISGLKACPFAVDSWNRGRVLLLPPNSDPIDALRLLPDYDVAVLPLLDYSEVELTDLCDRMNSDFPRCIFLDSHPNQPWTVGGSRTAWQFPAVLIQDRADLQNARLSLMKSGFYMDWESEFLRELKII